MHRRDRRGRRRPQRLRGEFVHPALAGSGLRLFDDDGPEQPLRLVSSQPFATGVIYVVYAPDPNPPTGGYDEAKDNLGQE